MILHFGILIAVSVVSASRCLRICLVLGFQLVNRLLQPFAQSAFQLFLGSPFIKRIDGLATLGQVNVAAGKARFPFFCRDEIHQGAFCAGLSLLFIVEVDTSGGIFEHKVRSPRISRPSPVSTLFQEGQFRPQNRCKSICVLHGSTLPPYVSHQNAAMSVIHVTFDRDRSHGNYHPHRAQYHTCR